MDLRGFYKLAAVCAFVYALVSLASYLAWISASGFLAATSVPPSPDRVWQLLQAPGNQLSARLDILSYFLWIPALLGIFAFLRDRVPGRAMLGAAFVAFGLVAMFSASSLNAAAVNLAQSPVSDALKERLAAIATMAFSSFLPGLWGLSVANLFWGFALRSQDGLARMAGNLFLGQVVGFLIATVGFTAGNDAIGNSGILVQTLALVASYVCVGRLLQSVSREEPEVRPIQQKGRAGGASA
jgi:hypothetical protein